MRASARDYQVVDIASGREYHSIFDLNQVRAEISKPDSGATFLRADDELHIFRRPAVESDKGVVIWSGSLSTAANEGQLQPGLPSF